MMVDLYEVIYYILLVDSSAAVLVAWFGRGWYAKACFAFSKWFPATKGWTFTYLGLVLFIGHILGTWPMSYLG